MSRSTSLSPPLASFRRRLLLAMIIGIAGLAAGVSLATAWLESHKLRVRLIEEGEKIAENLARQSAAALTLPAKDGAVDYANVANDVLVFPDVQYVALYNGENKTIFESGKDAQWRPQAVRNDVARQDIGPVVHETDSTLHFVAPVFSAQRGETDSSRPLGAAVPSTERLGYVHVVLSKNALHEAQGGIFANNVGVALIFGVMLSLLARVLVYRITSPSQEWPELVRRSGGGGGVMHVPVAGSSQVKDMAHVFNGMMTALEERDKLLLEQNENLESLVISRTRELIEARDQALLASRHKSDFLANMSHELRTPLNAIIGYTEIVMEEMEVQGSESIVTDLRRVHKAANNLLEMINGILDLAKIEAGRMDVWLEPTDLNELVEDVAGTIQVLIGKNNNKLSVEMRGDGEPVMIDGVKLRQIMINLLGNAAKFTADGQIDLCVEKTSLELRIAVSDTGIGMTEEQQAHLFEEFRQADMGTTRKYGGTGLGLHIAQRLCHLMGGEIGVRSVPQLGSTFSVCFPLPIKAPNVVQSK